MGKTLDLDKEVEKELDGRDDTPLPFGKYKGETPSWVAREDSDYLIWFWQEVDNAEDHMSEELYISLMEDDPMDNYF